MLKKIKERKIIVIALFAIILASVLVRTYNYHDWLFFKWDQARDATLLSKAVEDGPGYLPLLGPRAAKADGDYLRLGPAYYYTQYLSGVIFQSTKPDVFAYPDLLFSILTIPLFYFFLRLYFSGRISLISTALYAGSFIIIQYSRFSWNPNSVPFFMLLSLYGFLRFIKEVDFKKKIKWISLWAFGFAIASQYHFFALFSLSATFLAFFGLFVLKNVKKENRISLLSPKEAFSKLKQNLFTKKILVYSLASFFILGFFYFPVFLSEINTDWNNTKSFVLVVADRSDVDEEAEEDSKTKTFSEKLTRNFREQAKGYSLITIGKSHREGKKADPITVTFGLVLIFGSLALATKKYFSEKDSFKKSYLLILVLWSGLFFVITIPNSYQLRPRYFVPVFPVPFIMLGLWFSFLHEQLERDKFRKFAKYYWPTVCLISFAFLGINTRETALWFKEQADSQKKSVEIQRTLILKKQDGITLGQLERAVDYMYKKRQSDHVIFYAKPEYKIPLKYLFDQKKNAKLLAESIEEPPLLEGSEILFAVVSERGGEDSVKESLKPYLEKVSEKQFGQLLVIEMKIDKGKVANLVAKDKQEKLEKQSQEEDKISVVDEKIPRLFWKDFFGPKENDVFNEMREME